MMVTGRLSQVHNMKVCPSISSHEENRKIIFLLVHCPDGIQMTIVHGLEPPRVSVLSRTPGILDDGRSDGSATIRKDEPPGYIIRECRKSVLHAIV